MAQPGKAVPPEKLVGLSSYSSCFCPWAARCSTPFWAVFCPGGRWRSWPAPRSWGPWSVAAVALILAGDRAHDLTFCQWFGAGEFTTAMNVHYDPLAAVMALMVTFVAAIIHLYSAAFMRDDADYVRYFCYLNLFVFAMLVITVADNLIFVYLGWEGVGFCSYGLIGFWYRD